MVAGGEGRAGSIGFDKWTVKVPIWPLSALFPLRFLSLSLVLFISLSLSPSQSFLLLKYFSFSSFFLFFFSIPPLLLLLPVLVYPFFRVCKKERGVEGVKKVL